MGAVTPWRDAGKLGSVPFGADGFTPADGEDNPRARIRIVAPDFFNVMGVPLLAGRDFTPEDRRGPPENPVEQVVIVSQSLAERIYPNGEALNHKVWWIDPYFGPKPVPRRIVGIVGDVDDERIARGPVMAVHHPLAQFGVVAACSSGHRPIRIRRDVDHADRPRPVDQPAGRAPRHWKMWRGRVLLTVNTAPGSPASPVALPDRTPASPACRVRRQRGRVSSACGLRSDRRHLLLMRCSRKARSSSASASSPAPRSGFFAGIASSYFQQLTMPGLAPLLGAAAVLIGAAIAASLMPAARASRVDILQALRSE
jgi:hypothetical protein